MGGKPFDLCISGVASCIDALCRSEHDVMGEVEVT